MESAESAFDIRCLGRSPRKKSQQRNKGLKARAIIVLRRFWRTVLTICELPVKEVQNGRTDSTMDVEDSGIP